MRRLIFYVGLLGILLPSFAQVSSEWKQQIIAILEQNNEQLKSLEADFEQEKTAYYFTTPQVSNGKFYYKSPNQLHWQQLHPTPLDMIITDNKMVLKENGQTKNIPAAGQFVKFFLSFFSADFLKSQLFEVDIFEDLQNKQYRLELNPTKDRLKKRFETITLMLDKDQLLVESIELIAPNKDKTMIRFSNHRLNTPNQTLNFK